MNHEDWTIKIIKGDTEVGAVLRTMGEDFPERVAAVIRKDYDKPLIVNLVSSPLDADRMDYLLRDAYFTGVNYGTIDMDRIIRMLRPYQGRIVVKQSGMHAVEDYLMSRYQMYWQIYFHPVTRSSDIILRQIFKRAGELYHEGFEFTFLPHPLPGLFNKEITVKEYLLLDEALIQTAFMQWRNERDEMLSSLCSRFMDRKLYKYVEIESLDMETIDRIKTAFGDAGLNPEYDLEIDFPTDLPYDVFRPDSENWKKQILLLDTQERLHEISEVSDIVRSISGLHKGKNNLYFPHDKVMAVSSQFPEDIFALFEQWS
ncbi:hypothetical protein D3C77_440550 [compost metagenome]